MAQMIENIEQLKVGEIVANDFRTAEIFRKAGIDFCCGGEKSLLDTCTEKGIEVDWLKSQLQHVETLPTDPSQNYSSWTLDFLCDYIVNVHHNYVKRTLPELVFYTNKIANVHGNNHPELFVISDLFSQINTELLQHLKNEEGVLFPAIKDVILHNSSKEKDLISSEINRMWEEHEFAGGAMDQIRQITHNYTVPSDGCSTYHLTFQLLEQFEDDLHVHVHIENNILFPKALELTNK